MTTTSIAHDITDEFAGHEELVKQLPYTPLIARAYAVAVEAHRGQKRRSGDAYVNHALRTAVSLLNLGEEVICAALLHDVLEDSDYTADNLREEGFSEAVVAAVIAVSKMEGESYDSLVERAAAHQFGRLVKYADNLDNSSPTQLACFSPDKKAKQQRKYLPARVTLRAAIPAHELVLIAA